MKLSTREKVLIVIVLILALGAVYYFYFLTPYNKEMADIQTKIDAKNSSLQVLNVHNTQLKIMEKQISDLTTQNKDLLEKIPTGFDQAELLNFINQMIDQKGIKIGFSFQQPMDYTKVDSTQAVLNFYTNYANLKVILQQLKDCKYNNRIVSLTATTVTDQTAVSGTYNINVTINAEFFNLKGTIPAGKTYAFDNIAKGNGNLIK